MQPRAARVAYLTLLACAASTVVAGTALAPALPSIREHFASLPHVDSLVRLIVTLPAFGIAVAAPWIGRVADRFGRRRVLLGSLALYAGAGASGLYVVGLWQILVGRALLGVAAAGIMTSSTAIAASMFDAAERGRFLARQASVMSLAGVASVAAGGVLAGEHWRAPFAIHLLAAPLGVLAHAFVLETPPPVAKLASAREERGRPPRNLYALAVVAMAFVFMVPFQVPFLLASEGPRFAGFAIAVSTLAGAISSWSMARALVRDRPTLRCVGEAFVVMALGYGLVGATHGATATVIGLVIAGLGSGRILPALGRAIVASTSERTRAARIGALTSSIYAGQFLSPAIAVVLDARASVRQMFLRAAIALVLTAFVLLVAARRPPAL